MNQILVGNAPEKIAQFPDESIDCVVTSPPYWSKRDYGKQTNLVWDSDNGCLHDWKSDVSICDNLRESKVSSKTAVGSNKELSFRTGKKVKNQFCSRCGAWQGQLGLEPHYDLYIKHLVGIFDVFYRKLKQTGSLWVNMGDTYSTKSGTMGTEDNNQPKWEKLKSVTNFKQPKIELPDKSLIMIPERFARGMINHGWILRNRIIWKKPNSMPMSATDRFTDDYEFLYHFVKSSKTQFWVNEKTLQSVLKRPPGIKGTEGIDWEWIIHKACEGKGCSNKRCDNGLIKSSLWHSHDYYFEQQFETYKSKPHEYFASKLFSIDKTSSAKDGLNRFYGKIGRNVRSVWGMTFEEYMDWCEDNWHVSEMLSSVWEIQTDNFSAEHFACYPRKLVKTPIESTCPKEICNQCGLPRVKVYRATGEYDTQGGKGSKTADYLGVSPTSSLRTKEVKIKEFVGYSDCFCGAGFHPGIVLDLFSGSGTTCEVAQALGRNWIGIEINPDYVDIAYKYRLHQKTLGF